MFFLLVLRMTTIIDISGLDKIELLKGLYDALRWKQPIVSNPGIFSYEQAKFAVQNRISYFCNRLMFIKISGDSCDTQYYDKIAGKGTFLKVVDKMRNRVLG